jgi:SpoVK/Ycf46/Vps4 family AAA+-type ATPase
MPALTIPPGVEGIVAMHELPDPAWESRWTRIVVPDDVKERLLNFTLFSLKHRARMDAVRLPVHGLIVLAGPPGTGKTTLAGGLADQAARALGESVLFVEVNPHAFPSQMLGESQRSVARLFDRTLPDVARRGGPTIVLLDEVESLAVSRAGASLETNPVDVHRATDAVLAGVDQVARACPNLIFVATTNHAIGVDEAFLSRADLVEEIGLPNAAAVELILRDTLHQLLGDDDYVGAARRGGETLSALAKACVAARLDARRVRKLVLRALASRRELALSPDKLRLEDVAAALRAETE